MKNLSQSEKRRIEAQKGQEEKPVVKKDTVTLTAVENTTLADGTFVPKGAKVDVSAEYAERVKAEKNRFFK